MALGMFRRLSTLTKRATGAGSEARHVAGALGIKQALTMPVGIDFGVGALKIMQVNPGDPPSLIAASCLETPEELLFNHEKRLAFQIQALPKLIRQGGFKGRRGSCSIPAWQMMCKHLQFQRTDGIALDALVSGAIASQMNADPDAYVHRHIEVSSGGTSGKTEVILIAAARELVDRLMKAMMDAKLEPVGMHSEFSAALRAFDYLNRRGEDAQKATLYLDFGTLTTKVMIAHGPLPVFARVVELGGRHLDEAIAKQLSCDLREARRRRLELDDRLGAPATVAAAQVGTATDGTAATDSVSSTSANDERRVGNPQPGLSSDVTTQENVAIAPQDVNLDEPLEILTDEVQMSLRYHAGQFNGRKVERVVFLGGEARHRGLCQHIAKALRIPAQMADPVARIARTGSEPALGVDFKKPQPGWAVVLGLCLSPTDL